MQVVSFNQVISLTENFIPIFFSFYIGSWSDKFGRKVSSISHDLPSSTFPSQVFIVLCMFGKVVASVANLFGGVYLDGMNRWVDIGCRYAGYNITGYTITHGRWVWLAAYMPVQNITGGWMALVMVTYSFIADNSSPR